MNEGQIPLTKTKKENMRIHVMKLKLAVLI